MEWEWIIGPVILILVVAAVGMFVKHTPNPVSKQFNRDQYKGKKK